AGTAGGLVFTGVYLAEGATRAGYRALAQPISALSLGPGGWVQQLNFVIFGVLVCASAAGWRAALAPGRGGVAFPVLRVAAGVGLVMDGLFAQDPSGGYPPGARAAVPTVHGQVHTLFAMITITALASGCFVLAARFAAEPSWRRWAVFAAAAGGAAVGFIAPVGAPGGHGGGAGGWAGWRGCGKVAPGQVAGCLRWRCSPGWPFSAVALPGPATSARRAGRWRDGAGRPGGAGPGPAAEPARRGRQAARGDRHRGQP